MQFFGELEHFLTKLVVFLLFCAIFSSSGEWPNACCHRNYFLSNFGDSNLLF